MRFLNTPLHEDTSFQTYCESTGKKWYHVIFASKLQYVKKKGLTPKTFYRESKGDKHIWLMHDQHEALEQFVHAFMAQEYGVAQQEGSLLLPSSLGIPKQLTSWQQLDLVILRIDFPENEPFDRFGHWRVRDHVPPENIKVHKQISMIEALKAYRGRLTYLPYPYRTIEDLNKKFGITPQPTPQAAPQVPKMAPLAKVWYHGTSAKMGRSIAKDKQIIPGKMPQQDEADARGNANMTYLTSTSEVANEYARRRGKKGGRALITVELTDELLKKAEPDEEVLIWMYYNWDASSIYGNEEQMTPEDLRLAFGPDSEREIKSRIDIWDQVVEWIEGDAPKPVKDEWADAKKMAVPNDDVVYAVMEHLPRNSKLWNTLMAESWSIAVPGPIPVSRVVVSKTPSGKMEEVPLG